MRYCPICKGPFRPREPIAVLAYPVTCQNNKGSYSVFGDFLDNEEIMHLKCFKKHSQQLRLAMDNEKYQLFKRQHGEPSLEAKVLNNMKKEYNIPSILKDLFLLLKQNGEDVTMSEISRFLKTHPNISTVEEGFTSWIENRNKVEHDGSS